MSNEARYPCPVCLGLPMNKIKFDSPDLVLDACSRCGGMWFDAGEVDQLKQVHTHLANKHITLKDTAFKMQCHQCSARMDRNTDHCPQCNWHNILDCPVCDKPMTTSTVKGIKLDYCKDCKGVWFDNIELAAIWNGELDRMTHDHQPSGNYTAGDFAVDAAGTFLDILLYTPHRGYYGGMYYDNGYYSGTDLVADTLIHAPDLAAGAVDLIASAPGAVVEGIASAPEVAGAAVEMLASAPEVAGAVVEGIAWVAGSIFELLGEIIGGLFD